MGQAVIGYAVFMVELFILLAAAMSVKTALWMFCVVHVSCAVGAMVCLWWERETHGGMLRVRRR